MPVDLAVLAAVALQAGYPEPVAEWRFHPTRQWRLDLAWPLLLVGLEREGYARGGGAGRHQRGDGYANDCEKYTEAAIAGWLLVRVTGRQIQSGQAAGLLLRALAVRTATLEG